MAWYNITYACGHEDREQIYGKGSERQHRADWLGNNKVCKDCWIKGRAEADRKRALAAAGLSAPATSPEQKKNETEVINYAI